MAKIVGYVMTDRVGSKSEFEFEIDDDELAHLSEREIDDMALEAMYERIEWNYEVVDE